MRDRDPAGRGQRGPRRRQRESGRKERDGCEAPAPSLHIRPRVGKELLLAAPKPHPPAPSPWLSPQNQGFFTSLTVLHASTNGRPSLAAETWNSFSECTRR